MGHHQPEHLHWGYGPWAPAPPPPPPHLQQLQPLQPQGPPPLKRPHSESDDCDDAFSEESNKDRCSSPGEADSCQMLSRKKRRGIIEKRRRDRINTSLLELRRLVPTAFEKQGSAKLEKAEILQMTVEHLKSLHAKGTEGLGYDPSKLAMDYHSIGFRECAAEVARYLVTVEGLDLQDPLRLRLMSHLQCFAAQRELAKQPAPCWPAPSQEYQQQHDTSASSNNSSFETSTTSCESGASSPNETSSGVPPPSGYHHLEHPHHQGYHTPYHPPDQSYHSPVTSQKPYRPWGAELAY
ncbi:hypothetical protein AAG570_005943 [Ranatra chinensis]|uniref:Hairy/enhancer-of-split related with YRPW motif protein n=1 Tax=Ranatra chinensis TaxID=642074 RepID=A0ABD0Y9J0_9HEMI